MERSSRGPGGSGRVKAGPTLPSTAATPGAMLSSMDKSSSLSFSAGVLPAGIAALVRSPWSMSYGPDVRDIPGIIVPDAHVEFVFQLGHACDLRRLDGTVLETPRVLMFAQRRGALELVPHGANTLLGFRVAPAVACILVGRPLDDLWDRAVDLEALPCAGLAGLVEQMAGLASLSRWRLLGRWLALRLCDWDAESCRNHALQLHLLWTASGTVPRLADEFGVTDRTLRRHFARHAGLSPKQFSLSGRILRAAGELLDQLDRPVADIALAAGFADQAAFTNTFRDLVGLTPSRLRREPVVLCERRPA